MRHSFRLLSAAAVTATILGCGITGNLRLDPGYAAFGSPGIRDTNRDFALSLGPLPLALARKVMADDPAIAPLLQGLKAVRVYTYEIDGDAAPIVGRLEATRVRLTAEGWHPVVAVRDDGEHVAVLTRMRDREVRGIAVMTRDDTQIVFVNLIGELQPQMLGAAMAALDVDLPAIRIVRDADEQGALQARQASATAAATATAAAP